MNIITITISTIVLLTCFSEISVKISLPDESRMKNSYMNTLHTTRQNYKGHRLLHLSWLVAN